MSEHETSLIKLKETRFRTKINQLELKFLNCYLGWTTWTAAHKESGSTKSTQFNYLSFSIKSKSLQNISRQKKENIYKYKGLSQSLYFRDDCMEWMWFFFSRLRLHEAVTFLFAKFLKGTVSVNLSDPPYKDDNARFTTAPLKPLFNQ